MIWIAIDSSVSTVILLLVLLYWLAANLDGFGDDNA